jgi:transposase
LEKVIDYKALYEASLQKNAVLVDQNNSLHKENSSLLAKQEELLHSLDSLRRQLFGMKSDKQVKHAIAGQLELFNLAAPDTLVEQIAEELKEEIKERQAKDNKVARRPKRMLLPEHLERKEVIIDPQGDLSGYKIIGSDSCEVLVIDPMKMWVKRIIRRKWALIDSQDISRPGIREAPAPSRTVKGGLFDESVLAFLLVYKYVYHMPLYRIKQMFTRQGIPISASTLSDNVAAVIRALEPIYRALKKEVLGSRYVQSDETTYKVLRSGQKGKCHNGYMWAFHSPPSGLLFFQYCTSREHIHPAEILKGFHGVLQTDGFSSYQKVLRTIDNSIQQLYCMCHIRRKFDESAQNDLAR